MLEARLNDLKLYDYGASANCYKVRLLLAQLGRDYERVAVDIFGGDTLTDDFELLNPFRSTPVLQIGDARTLIESNAILWYLADGTPFLNTGELERAETIRWLIYEQTDVVPAIGGLRFRLLTKRFAANSPEAEARRKNAYDILRILDTHLSTRPFLVGDEYSIADISVYSYAHVAPEAGIDISDYPSFRAWLDRIEHQDSFTNDLEPYPPNASVLAGTSIYG